MASEERMRADSVAPGIDCFNENLAFKQGELTSPFKNIHQLDIDVFMMPQASPSEIT